MISDKKPAPTGRLSMVLNRVTCKKSSEIMIVLESFAGSSSTQPRGGSGYMVDPL